MVVVAEHECERDSAVHDRFKQLIDRFFDICGINEVAGDDDEVGLFGGNHFLHHRCDSLFIAFVPTEMGVGELDNLEFAVFVELQR